MFFHQVSHTGEREANNLPAHISSLANHRHKSPKVRGKSLWRSHFPTAVFSFLQTHFKLARFPNSLQYQVKGIVGPKAKILDLSRDGCWWAMGVAVWGWRQSVFESVYVIYPQHSVARLL